MKTFFVLIAVTMIGTAGLSQTIGSKVTFPGVDGRTYTGNITDIQGGEIQCKI